MKKNIWYMAFVMFVLAVIAMPAMAQEVAGSVPTSGDIIADFLIGLIAKFPYLSAFVAAVGALRLLVKPIMSAIKMVVDATPTQKDNAVLDGIEASPAYKGFIFVIDWLASIKLPGAK